MSEVRLHSNQSALIRGRRSPLRPRPHAGWTDTGPAVTFCQGYDHPYLWMNNRNAAGVTKHSCQLRSSHHFHFPNSVPIDKDGSELCVFTGCQRGINVTVFRLKMCRHAKKAKERNAEINSYS